MVKRGRKKQKGGFIPAAVAGVASTLHTLGQKYKPVSALDDFLTSRGLKSDGKSTLGKIANAALSVGRSLGYGQNGGAQLSRPDGSQVSFMPPQVGQNQVGTGKKRAKMLKF